MATQSFEDLTLLPHISVLHIPIMCRMLTVISRRGHLTPADITKIQTTMTVWGDTNDDGTGVAWVDDTGHWHVEKSGKNAERFFDEKSLAARIGNAKVRAFAGHVRFATTGGATCGAGTEQGAQPFCSCNEDFIFMHNGWFGEEMSGKLRAAITEEHPVRTEVDSELLMHRIEQEGFERAMTEMAVPGTKFNVLLMNRDGSVLAHGDNALIGGGVADADNRLVLLASDTVPFSYFYDNGITEFPRLSNFANYNVFIAPGGVVSVQPTVQHEVGPPPRRTEPSKSIHVTNPSFTRSFAKAGKKCPTCRQPLKKLPGYA